MRNTAKIAQVQFVSHCTQPNNERGLTIFFHWNMFRDFPVVAVGSRKKVGQDPGALVEVDRRVKAAEADDRWGQSVNDLTEEKEKDLVEVSGPATRYKGSLFSFSSSLIHIFDSRSSPSLSSYSNANCQLPRGFFLFKSTTIIGMSHESQRWCGPSTVTTTAIATYTTNGLSVWK